MIVMDLLKIENICYSETFFLRKNAFFIDFIIVILTFKVLKLIIINNLNYNIIKIVILSIKLLTQVCLSLHFKILFLWKPLSKIHFQ